MSIAIACHEMGFDLTGWEIDPDYYREGMKRVEAYVKQFNLFAPEEKYGRDEKQLTIL